MSTFDLDDLVGPGYVLAEDGAVRLRTLREHMALLSKLAKARMTDEQGGTTTVSMDEVAFCLALLAEQADQVLDAVSRPPRRDAHKAAHRFEPDEAADAVQDVGATGDDDFSFGLTLDQVDALHRLIALLTAHGDVVAATQTTEFVDHTVPVIGHAIFDSAQAVRDILREVETQRLAQGARTKPGVREARPTYDVVPAQVSLLLAPALPRDAARVH